MNNKKIPDNNNSLALSTFTIRNNISKENKIPLRNETSKKKNKKREKNNNKKTTKEIPLK